MHLYLSTAMATMDREDMKTGMAWNAQIDIKEKEKLFWIIFEYLSCVGELAKPTCLWSEGPAAVKDLCKKYIF